MAKKRKLGLPFGQPKAQNRTNEDSNLRINGYEDVANSEDEFHINRDMVLLDETPEAKRRRKVQEKEQFLEPSDEEVLGYEEPSDEDEFYEEEDRTNLRGAESANGYHSESSEADQDEAEEDENFGGWGDSKKAYYDADVIETEQDALDEEAEAKRLQQKRLKSMTTADYGFEESGWKEQGKVEHRAVGEEEDATVVTEVLPPLQITDEMDPTQRLKILKTRYPEFEPLSKEFLELQPVYRELKVTGEAADVIQQKRSMDASGVTGEERTLLSAVVKLQALSAYLGALSMYFALLTSTASTSSSAVALSASPLREHPIMDRLVRFRHLWTRAKDLKDEDVPEVVEDNDPVIQLNDQLALDSDMERTLSKPKIRRPKKSKAQRDAEAAQREIENRRAERMAKTEQSLSALSFLTESTSPGATSRARAGSRPVGDASGDIGDEEPLTAAQTADKALRRKSLRFYTSQIAQKANKRSNAGKDAGGDADVPHKERLRDRQARLTAEAEKRGRKARNQPGDDLGGESDEEDRRQAKEIRGEHDGKDDQDEEDYYDLVASRASAKKAAKAARAAAEAEASAAGGVLREVEGDEIGADGKRKISYAIEKNKGLTPRRKKEVRNPRVKKRKKFEEKSKKLGSVKAVYKGGEGRGGYAGELTGIKSGLVRSTKL